MWKPSTSIVIPCFNEALGIGELVDELLLSFDDARVIIVDDSSPDGSADVARSRGERVQIVSRPSRLGLASAIHAGLSVAASEAILVMDADGSHLPSDATRLVRALEHADFAVGSRWISGGTAPGLNSPRTVWSRGSNHLVNALLGYQVHDWTAGFLAMRRSAMAPLIARPPVARGWTGSLELKFRALQAGLRLVEVPVTFAPRRHGVSKLRVKDVVEAMTDLLTIRRSTSPISAPVDDA